MGLDVYVGALSRYYLREWQNEVEQMMANPEAMVTIDGVDQSGFGGPGDRIETRRPPLRADHLSGSPGSHRKLARRPRRRPRPGRLRLGGA